jgi:hypothetical protein
MPKTGKGKKLCSNCKNICAAASKKCSNCQIEFSINKVEKEVPTKKRIVLPYGYEGFVVRLTIYAPSGVCPIKIKENPSEDDVITWVDNVRFYFLQKKQTWLVNYAFCYYMRHVYDTFSKEYNDICQIIKKIPDIKYIEIKEEEKQ